MYKVNLIGKKFGKLTVLEFSHSKYKSSISYWKCKCDCGNEIITSTPQLKKENKPRSCGCSRNNMWENKFGLLIGSKYNRWTILEKYEKKKNNRQYFYKCQCDCGGIGIVSASSLRNGRSKSCGCVKNESASKRFTKHGMSRERLYHIWNSMIHRCYDKTSKSYPIYGGRGINVCKNWKDSYACFKDWSLNNGHQNDLTIDRINNNEGYFPENCRWITKREQSNNKRNTPMFTYNGKTQSLSFWASELGIKYSILYKRINRMGLSFEEAINHKYRHPKTKLKQGFPSIPNMVLTDLIL